MNFYPCDKIDRARRSAVLGLALAGVAGLTITGCGATDSQLAADQSEDDAGVASATVQNVTQSADDLGPPLRPGDETPPEAIGYYDPAVDGAGADDDLDDAAEFDDESYVLQFDAEANEEIAVYIDDDFADSEWLDEWGDDEFVFNIEGLDFDELTELEKLADWSAGYFATQPNAKIVGRDDRIHVADAGRYPWSTVGLLWVEYGDGKVHLGTGAMISRRHVLTAAHVLFDESNQRWPNKIVYIPAKNGDSEPLGRVGWQTARVFSSKHHGSYRKHDIGLLTLNQDTGDQTGWLGLAVRSNSYMTQVKLNTAGYPGDKGSYDQYATAGSARSINNDVISTWLDNMPGQSGSPMWEVLNGQRYVLGVLNAQCLDSCNVNFGSRISSNVFNWISSAIGADS